MKNKILLSCVFTLGFLLLGAGCTAAPTVVVNTPNIQPLVETTPTEVIEPSVVSKTFESENGDFSYTLNWNMKVITLSETQYKWSTEYAPSFDIVGGGTITVATGLIDSPGYKMSKFINDTYYEGDNVWPTIEPVPSEAGASNPVYYFNQPVEMNKDCIVQYAVVKGLNEALAIRLEDCAGNDMKSNEAFGDLISDLTIVRH